MPTFEARKTLLIGLGSTGNQILKRIQENIRWEFGDPAALPWISYLGIETDLAALELGAADTKHITIPENDFGAVLRNPSHYHGKLALDDWLDISRLRSSGMTAVQTGAGNNRMVGRLALLWERNFNDIRDEVKTRLNSLNQIDNNVARQALTAVFPKQAWQVAFDGTSIDVVTVGTLCGGTCSGIFVDFGYLLRRLIQDLGLTADSRAIFTLPSKGVSDAFHASNTFAGLTELDYYSDTINVYQVKYPDRNDVTDQTGYTPYDRQFLVESPGIGINDIETLNEIIGHYLFGRIMFRPLRAQTDAIAVNPMAIHFEQLSNCGAPQRYFTFGMANLEYPATQIRRACSARLIGDSLGVWLQPFTATIDETWIRDIGLEEGALTNALLDQNGNSVIAQVESEVRACCKRAAARLNSLQELEDRLPNVFDSIDAKAPTLGELTPGFVRKTVDGNWRAVYKRLCTSWQQRVQRILTGEGSGNIQGALDRVLKEAETASAWLMREIKDLETRMSADSKQSTATDLLSKIKQEWKLAVCYEEDKPLLSITPVKAIAIRKQIQSVQRLGLLYTDERKTYVVGKHGLLPVYQELLTFARRLLTRIKSEGNAAGVQATADRMQQHFEASYDRLASVKPVTPGRVIFTPKEKDDLGNNTVDQAYAGAIARLSEEQGAFEGLSVPETQQRLYRSLVTQWMAGQQLVEELFRDPGSFWNPILEAQQLQQRAQINPKEVSKLEDQAGEYFVSLLHKSIINEVSAQQINQELPNVNSDAKLLLKLNLGDACHEEAANKRWSFLFHPDSAQNAATQEVIANQTTALHINRGAVLFQDLRRITILEERCAFPLSSLDSLSNWHDTYRSQRNQGKDPHTRADVTWAGITSSLDHRQRLLRAQQLFVTAVGLQVIEFVGYGAAKPYLFVYSPYIGDDRKKEFAGDVRRAAYDLDLDDVVSAKLQEKVEAKVHELTNATAAAMLANFIRLVGGPEDKAARRQFAAPLPLTETGLQIAQSQLYVTVETFLADHLPQTYQELLGLLGDKNTRLYVSKQEGDHFSNGDVVKMNGTYCTVCHQFLAPMNAAENAIPFKCVKCGRNMKVRNL